MKIKLLSVLAPLLVIVSSCVQPEIEVFGSVSGIVKDSQTNKVLEGVKVTLSPGGVSQLTGQDGTFSFEELDQAEYTLSFVKDGYEDESQKVSVKPGLAASVQVGLFPIVPELELSTSVLDYGEELTTLSIDISNKGKGELRWTLTEDIEWLEASVLEGAVTTEKSSVVLTISRAALEEGNYMDSFVISSNGGSETVMVMVGVATVRFEVTPAQADFSTVTNTIQLTLKNLGKKNLEWVAKASKEWVSLSKESGLISKEDYVNVIVSREGLSPGHYDAEIVFVSDGGEISVPVLMDVAVDEKPTVTAESVSGVSYNGAVLHGTVVSVGSDKITKYGFCWSSTNDSPTLEDHFSNLGDCSSPEEFESVVSNLSSDTKYFFRAYAENSVGISYSDKVLTFTTTGLPALPAVTTGSVEEITSSSAKVKGKITSLGNVAAVTAYGHVWSTSPEPTLETGKSTNLGETGAAESFVSELKGLEVATNYYVRAYAVNEKGAAYGDVVTFVTDKTDVKVETSEVKDIVHNAATAGGKIVSYGGHKILERGVCWDDEALPTIEDDFMTSDASGDEWSCRITGLELESTYFVRAYVKTEEGGVYYGTDQQFTTTKEIKLPVLSGVTVSNVTVSGASFVSKIESDGNSKITECGFCLSEKENPAIGDKKITCDVNSADLSATLTDLEDGKTYYVSAFATNAMGTAYSEAVSFTTLAVTVPTPSVVSVSNVTTSSATFSAEMLSDGNSPVIECGFCWSDSVLQPTINESHQTCESLSEGLNVTGLTDGRTYYVRAFARNSAGLSYGEVTEFTTIQVKLPEVSSVLVENIGRTAADVSASVIDMGNSDVTDYGFCWSVNAEPTISTGTKVSCFTSSSVLSFHVKLTGLPELSTVYVRAYAVNSKGTSYGEAVAFTTVEVDVDVWDGTTVASKFAGGMGTETNPIIIASADQFALFAKNIAEGTVYGGVYVKLSCNIGLNGFDWPYSKGSFSGVFDGDGKVVDGYRGTGGLFETNNGTVKNLTLKGKITSSDDVTGGIADNNSGTILNCEFVGDIAGLDNVGGISGENYGVIDGCVVEGTISAKDNVGGVSGYMTAGKIINTLNVADVSGVNDVGGILGEAYMYNANFSVENNINMGGIKGTTAVGGILGNFYRYRHYSCSLANSVNYGTHGKIGRINDVSLCKGGYWLYDIVNNIGQEDGLTDTEYSDFECWFNRDASACYIKGTDDLVEQLNSWVSSNSSGVTYKKWKYETVDGYACPVFDEE